MKNQGLSVQDARHICSDITSSSDAQFVGIPSVLSNWVLYLAFALSIFMTGFSVGHYREKAVFDKFVLETKQAGELAQQKANETIAHNQQLKDQYEDLFRKRINSLGGNGLYNTSTRGNSLPTNGNTSASLDGKASNDVSHPDLIYDCQVTTVQLLTIQDWLKETLQKTE